MEKTEDGQTRYFIDLDLKSRSILNWNFDQRINLEGRKTDHPHHVRIFITRGQFNKLETKNLHIE